FPRRGDLRATGELRHRFHRPRALQHADRPVLPRDRAVLAGWRAGLVGPAGGRDPPRQCGEQREFSTGGAQPPHIREVMMRRKLLGGTFIVAAAAAGWLLLAGQAQAAGDTIKVGVLATFEGPFAILGEDSLRGATMAFKEHNNMAGGKKLEIVTGSS